MVYASGRDGWSVDNLDDERKDLGPLCEHIVKDIPAPQGSPDGPLQVLISTLDYSPYLGRIGIGKITSGKIDINQATAVAMRDGSLKTARIAQIFRFESNKKYQVNEASCGDIVGIAGMNDVTVGCTYTSPDNPIPLPPMPIDPPTISMNFLPNGSPFAGQEGTYVTSSHLEARLRRETMSDVALQVVPLGVGQGFTVSGRGELHLSVLIEQMRREGYEMACSTPKVLFHEIDGKKCEPIERVIIDCPDIYNGAVMEKLGSRKGELVTMEPRGTSRTRLEYLVPTRCLFGYRSEFMTDTHGEGIINTIFDSYQPYKGDVTTRFTGSLVASEAGESTSYGIFNAQDRGQMFIGAQCPVYEGMIVGSNPKQGDIAVNVCKKKHLTAIRSAGADEALRLVTPKIMSLEEAIEYIADDELIEVTPKSLRLRKRSHSHSDGADLWGRRRIRLLNKCSHHAAVHHHDAAHRPCISAVKPQVERSRMPGRFLA